VDPVEDDSPHRVPNTWVVMFTGVMINLEFPPCCPVGATGPPGTAGRTERETGMGIGMGTGERIPIGYGSRGTEEEEEEGGDGSVSRRDIGVNIEVGTSTGETLGEGVDDPVMSTNFGEGVDGTGNGVDVV
jgi:hypothetical protein